MPSFKLKHSFEQRLAESTRILKKFPDRIPIIVEKSTQSNNVPNIDKTKYLAPSSLTVGQFVYVIRKRIKMKPEQAIFLFINNMLPPSASLLSTVYDEHKENDKFLYIEYSGENTFG